MMNIHCHTPTLTTIDSRRLTVRSITYCRSASDADAEVRINRTRFDEAGRVVAQWDPRLWVLHGSDASTPANAEHLYTLTGIPLRSLSVDAGLRISLPGEVGQLLHSWDGRGSQQHIQYDTLLRPLAIFEHESNAPVSCAERYIYGSVDPICIDHNQYGQLIRHDDPAGTKHFNEFGITGELIEQNQHFLQTLESPNWPASESERDLLLETGAGYTTVSRFSPLGAVVLQTDAKGNQQQFDHTLGGQLREERLLLAGASTAKVIASSIHYNAGGQTQQQTAGNGVISSFDYSPQDGRLSRLRASRPQQEALQDLNYLYDPVGNILSIEDKALPVRFFANQRIEPINRYTYDSLYQLIEATGWESGSDNQGPDQIEDPQAVANYRQTYRYDAGGNLLELTHQGPQSHGRVLTAGKFSNRCLPDNNGIAPTEADIAAGFDENGNLRALEKGRTLNWDLRNQLSEVRPVERESGLDDSESYRYGADGMRQRKVRLTLTNSRQVINETRYLPGLEIRLNKATGEMLNVISARAARNSVQVLKWENSTAQRFANEQYCYILSDHLGACNLELDLDARVVSREIYHPFGTTALCEKGGTSQSSYRTLCYSGKEQDATGLYYYGLRYYIPWAQRWTCSDPAGYIDGFNLYSMVANNPITYVDAVGLQKTDPNDPEGLTEFKALGTARSMDLKYASNNTKVPSGASKKQRDAHEKENQSNPDNRITKNVFDKLVAHAFAFVDEPSVLPFYFNHFNIMAPPGGPTKYPGVDQNYELEPDLKTGCLSFGAYRIGDVQKYLGFLGEQYSFAKNDPVHHRVFSELEMKDNPLLSRTITQSCELQETVKLWVSNHIDASDNIIPTLAGGPGAHAEVRAINSVIALYPNDAEIRLSNVFLFTERLSSKEPVRNFEACYNCTGILHKDIKVRTGTGNLTQAEFKRMIGH
ncbi:RHS repeat-associated core domain-containing protein [Pseudomonas kulmbachensis]|uniref:RHS repeat-associated core domain-containing protein n=1 Tax=Pseudomonas kulmbachensis TaxID=3043408 RepID=UPI002AAFBBD8|nr:RHS repeat-associated core domain-containing protein [Pseudomonas sp. V3/3/4/13]